MKLDHGFPFGSVSVVSVPTLLQHIVDLIAAYRRVVAPTLAHAQASGADIRIGVGLDWTEQYIFSGSGIVED